MKCCDYCDDKEEQCEHNCGFKKPCPEEPKPKPKPWEPEEEDCEECEEEDCPCEDCGCCPGSPTTNINQIVNYDPADPKCVTKKPCIKKKVPKYV